MQASQPSLSATCCSSRPATALRHVVMGIGALEVWTLTIIEDGGWIFEDEILGPWLFCLPKHFRQPCCCSRKVAALTSRHILVWLLLRDVAC